MVSSESTLAEPSLNSLVQFTQHTTRGSRVFAQQQGNHTGHAGTSGMQREKRAAAGKAFVGREAQNAALDQAMRQEQWQGAVVVGQGGIGKTALIQNFLAKMPASTTTSYLRGTALTAGTPYGILGLLMGRSGPHNIQDISLAEVLKALAVNIGTHDSVGTPVVVVDNAEFADPWSALALSEMLRMRAIRLVLVCRRINGMALEFSRLWRTGELLRVDLPALNAAEARELLCNELSGPCSLTAATALWRKSAGNPLYLTTLVQQGLAAGTLSAVDGIWVWRQDRLRPAMPAGPGHARRLMNASQGNVEILQMVAVAGVLPVATLASIFPSADIDELLQYADLNYAGSGKSSVVVAHPIIASVLPLTISQEQSREWYDLVEDTDPLSQLEGGAASRRAAWAVAFGQLPVPASKEADAVSATAGGDHLAERAIVGGTGAMPHDDIRHCSAAQAARVAERAEMLSMEGRQDDALVLARALAARMGLTGQAGAAAPAAAIPVQLAAPLQRIYTVAGEWQLLEELLRACQERGVAAELADCVEFELSSGVIQAFQGSHVAATGLLSQGIAQLQNGNQPGWEALAHIAKLSASNALTSSDGGTAALLGKPNDDEKTFLERKFATVLADPTVPRLLGTLVQCMLVAMFPSGPGSGTTKRTARTSTLEFNADSDAPVQALLLRAMALDGSSAEPCDQVMMLASAQEGALADVLALYAKGVLTHDSTVMVQVVERACQMSYPSLSAKAADLALAFASAASMRSVRRQLQRLVHLPADLSEPASELSTRLTEREEAVGLLAAKGASNKEIAQNLGVSVRTVEGHLYQVYAKLQVTSRVELVPLLSRAVK